MAVTQRDIADRLKLSRSLVSGVLSNKAGVWASEETRSAIRHAAREMNYQPHAAASALRRGKTNVVACIFIGPTGTQAVIENIAACLGEIGYDALVRVLQRPEQTASALESLLFSGKCDAGILWGAEEAIAAHAPLLAESRIPFIVKGRHEARFPHWFQADFDHEGMMAQAVDYLVTRGRRCIAYIGDANNEVYSQRLLAGYRAAAEKVAGSPPREDYILLTDNDVETICVQMDIWMNLPPNERPDALVSGAGLGAWLAVERWLMPRGLRLGEEILIAGTAGNESPLMFGSGEAYLQAELTILADAICERMLIPLLTGVGEAERRIRLLPPLRPLLTLNLPLPPATVGARKEIDS